MARRLQYRSHMKNAIASLALVLSLALVACGSVDDPGTSPDAPAQCQALRAVYCQRVLTCSAGLTMAQCQDAFSASIDCGRAVGVSASYDRCLAELPTYDCAVFAGGATLPASCSGAVLTR